MTISAKRIDNLDIPFKDFMPGQTIQSGHFNDDMKDIEDKINEIVGEQNVLINETDEHVTNRENPHEVHAHQVGSYYAHEIDEIANEIKDGGLNNEVIVNNLLADDCVETRNIVNGSVTATKLDRGVGSQIDISNNMSIHERYTKTQVDALIEEKVGSGTYDKATIDKKFEEVQAGQIVDGTIGADKLKPGIGSELNISGNPSITDRPTRTEMLQEVSNNRFVKEWGYVNGSHVEVALRGGTSEEHNSFTGTNKEVTVDTTKNTLRVHDGITPGGTALATENALDNEINVVNSRIDDIVEDMGKSHNHDDLYSKHDHNHDDIYERIISEYETMRFTLKNDYWGMSLGTDDDSYVRTTRAGIIPYQAGGYGNIGTSGWRFAEGYFDNLNTKVITVAKSGNTSCIEFPSQTNDPGFIRHEEINNVSRMFFSVSDDFNADDVYVFGSTPGGTYRWGASINTQGDLWLNGWVEQEYPAMKIAGRYVYFDGQKPSHVPDGSISFG